jgi:hypothetical protein
LWTPPAMLYLFKLIPELFCNDCCSSHTKLCSDIFLSLCYISFNWLCSSMCAWSTDIRKDVCLVKACPSIESSLRIVADFQYRKAVVM